MDSSLLERGFMGSLVADALSAPVHWYYNREALDRDYPELVPYQKPRNPHPDSILWRSHYTALNEKGEILHGQAVYWGKRNIHYHQFLEAGENTLNFRLAVELYRMVIQNGEYDPDLWLERYIEIMRTPGWHRDTYLEEIHREFFTNLASGKKPHQCGINDNHIGGLTPVPALVAALARIGWRDAARIRETVVVHVGLTHQNRGVLEAAAHLSDLLCHLAEGGEAASAMPALSGWGISSGKLDGWSRLEDREVVGAMLSPACYIRDAFPASLFLFWKYQEDFLGGVVANARCGGDNAHRGAVVGSLLGAVQAISADLLDGLADCPIES